MVHRIRIRGHVIRTLGVRPSPSRLPPESCPSCFRFYNDDKHRRCIYLCCEFEDCLDCAINQNTFYCAEILAKSQTPRIPPVAPPPEVVTLDSDSDWETDIDDDHTMPLLEPHHNSQTTPTPPPEQVILEPKYSLPEAPSPAEADVHLNITSYPESPPPYFQMGCGPPSQVTQVKSLIPKNHRLPVVSVNPFGVQNYRKHQTSKKGVTSCPRKRGRPRKCRNA